MSEQNERYTAFTWKRVKITPKEWNSTPKRVKFNHSSLTLKTVLSLIQFFQEWKFCFHSKKRVIFTLESEISLFFRVNGVSLVLFTCLHLESSFAILASDHFQHKRWQGGHLSPIRVSAPTQCPPVSRKSDISQSFSANFRNSATSEMHFASRSQKLFFCCHCPIWRALP